MYRVRKAAEFMPQQEQLDQDLPGQEGQTSFFYRERPSSSEVKELPDL